MDLNNEIRGNNIIKFVWWRRSHDDMSGFLCVVGGIFPASTCGLYETQD